MIKVPALALRPYQVAVVNSVAVSSMGELDHTFKWRGAGGERFYRPSEMATSHLVNTLRMIWNHNMPEAARMTPYIEHDFSPYYTDKYMKQAIRQLSLELATRKLTATQQRVLDHMFNWLSTHQLENDSNAKPKQIGR